MSQSKRVEHWVGAAVCVVLLAQSLPLKAADGMRCAGVVLPTKEQAFGVPLVLNGMGVRSVTIFNIQAFVAGLYLPRRTRSAAEALSREQAKLVVITFLRDADRARMVDSIRSGIEEQSPRLRRLAQKNLPDLERRLPEPRKGHSVVFAYNQGRLEMRHDNQLKGSWNDAGLAEALFNSWLGTSPMDSDLKTGLLGGECD